jgi:hypothetical protein
MRKNFLTVALALLILIPCKSQSSERSSFLTFISYQKMSAYLDSSGKLEMTLGWEKSTDKIIIDAFGNRIKLKNVNDGKERLFVLGIKGEKYKSSGAIDIIPFYQCTDDKERRCTVRLMLQDSENITKHPSYLYIDYADITHVYQLFWNTEEIQGNVEKENTNNNSAQKQSKQGCLFISDSFNSISSALDEIDNTSFTFHDIYYPESMKISKALFYACEKKDGHMSLSLMILKTGDKDYILRNVPKNIWNDFRKAKSTDLYFEKNVKDKYKNILN